MQWCVAFLYDDALEVARRMHVDGHETFPDLEWRDGRYHFTRPNPFAGYLFVQYSHRWPSASLVAGVARLLSYEDDDGKIYPHLVPQSFLDDLPAEEIAPDAPCIFTNGDWVRITAGPHTGLFGQFQRRKHGTGIIMVDYFSRSVPICLPLNVLCLANPQSGASTDGEQRRTASA